MTNSTEAPLSLGEQLAQARDKKARADTEFMREQARKKDAETKAKFERVENFFKSARAEFTKRILAGATNPVITVGGPRAPELNDVERLLLIGQFGCELEKVLESNTHPYFSLWRDFQDWGKEQQLRVHFRYEHDGVGIHSWHVLVADPLTIS